MLPRWRFPGLVLRRAEAIFSLEMAKARQKLMLCAAFRVGAEITVKQEQSETQGRFIPLDILDFTWNRFSGPSPVRLQGRASAGAVLL